MKRILALVAAATFVIHLQADPRRIDPRTYLEHIKYLASDELEGRGNGTPGLEKAAEYIEKGLRGAGLEPAGDNGTFFQTFEITTGISVEAGNDFTMKAGRGATTFEIGRDYSLLSTSRDRSIGIYLASSCGVRISAPTLHTTTTPASMRGKAVLMFTHEPQENDQRSVFRRSDQARPIPRCPARSRSPRSHGAAASC